jgi:signal transduction histidine kinase
VGNWLMAGGALAIAGATVAADLTVAAVAAHRYRGSRDPHAFFLAVGFLVLGVQEALFTVWWPTARPSDFVRGNVAVIYAVQTGWAIAGGLFVFGLPWWDRRGRPPLRASRVIVPVATILVLADALIVWRYRDVHLLAVGDRSGFIAAVTLHHPGILGWVLAMGAIGLLGVAAVRELRAGDGERAHAWIGVAFLVAVPIQFAAFATAGAGGWLVRWAVLLQPVVPILTLAGLLDEERSDATRMRRASDRAEEVLGGRAEIASMIAHEVRGPAAVVRGIATTSLTHYDRLTDDERREFLSMIEQESLLLMTTVDQMSLALKVDARSLSYDMRSVDLAEIAVEAKDVAELGDHQVVGAAFPGVMVRGDRQRLIEVVRQLLNNAATFSPPGTPIQLVVVRDDPWIVLDVIDEGPGIPSEQRERVFTRFPNWRPSGYEEMPGSGLGLFISRGIVAEHSGEISAEDAPQGGTILRMRLPAEGNEGVHH